MSSYIGRFAPSPTGPLHLGSLYTALASFLDARHYQGTWLLRIEDLDPPREEAGATEKIIETLQAHHLHWDNAVVLQSQRSERYETVLANLADTGHSFFCTCSRKQLAAYPQGYPGFCRHHQTQPANGNSAAIRLKTDGAQQTFIDLLQGQQQLPKRPDGLTNDFVIKRKDQLYAYQLAVVVDDIDQGVNVVVRGNDILDSTFKQGYLYHALEHTPPTYLHLPVIAAPDGQKLSKQNHAPAIDNNQGLDNIRQALTLLNQPMPPTHLNLPDTLLFSIEHWDRQYLSRDAWLTTADNVSG
ncbi:Glutamyl-Q tRNA(Asp) synthetase [BD1-7 clade bacterium]|uniref:Glutamyl-Q tRNA(Asp) synthetase n=1 Tax=BD1-7 clade bacterium TaxID=2029982 RepID=A0A5S9MPP2_9GAMM|nr:Glutamyl-Q tRNA(Asp) synthetase [BD1-7 clade bacterium]CAA0085168.1 Glutamyl-Q tRNA(Asp) synthetase [BD1-7 clade bacterium]